MAYSDNATSSDTHSQSPFSPLDDSKAKWIANRKIDLLSIDQDVLVDAQANGEIDTPSEHFFFKMCVECADMLPSNLQEMLEDMAEHVARNEYKSN